GPGRMARRLLALAALAALLICAILLYPAGQWLVQDVLDKTMPSAHYNPRTCTADAEVPGHPASNVVDGVTNNYWGSPAPGATLDCSFDEPYRLLEIQVTPGPSIRGEIFGSQARPSKVEITATDAQHRTTTLEEPVDANPKEPAKIKTRLNDVVNVRIRVLEAANLTEGKHVAVGEIQFVRRN
ncbi:MAG: hypothetical protein IJH84_20680, partial [Saccharopolyspora sp.]